MVGKKVLGPDILKEFVQPTYNDKTVDLPHQPLTGPSSPELVAPEVRRLESKASIFIVKGRILASLIPILGNTKDGSGKDEREYYLADKRCAYNGEYTFCWHCC